MPEFLTAAIAYIGADLMMAGTAEAFGAFLLSNAAVIASSAILLGGLALSSIQARKAARQARDQYNASQVDRLVNLVSTVAPRDLVLGRVRKGGAVIFKGSAGTNKETFCAVIALAGHEIDAVEAIYFNDEVVTLDGSGYVTSAPYTVTLAKSGTASADGAGSATLAFTPVGGSVTAYLQAQQGTEQQSVSVAGNVVTTAPNAYIQYQYNETTPKAKVWWYLGTSSQTADATLISLFPTLWTSAHRGRGVAYLVCQFTYDETAFPSGLPVVTAKIRGAKVFDPRSSTTVWSDNPALLMRHVYQHASFGKATVSGTEDTRFNAAANACDTATVYTLGGVPQASRALFKANIVGQYGAAARSLFDDLSQAMGGMWAFAGGELYVRAGVYTASVLALTDADLAVIRRSGASEEQKPITISPHRERAQRFNVVNVRIWDDAQGYKEAALTPLKGSALITRDGAELAQEVTMPAVGYAPQALHVAGIMMRDARDPLSVTIPFKLRVYPVELFDTVDVTLTRYGWTAKTLTVLGREWTADGFLQLTLKETAAAIYTPDANFLATGYAANTSLPDPWDLPPITITAITSGPTEWITQTDGSVLSRVRVTWTAPASQAVLQDGRIEIQYRSALTSGEWASLIVPGSDTQAVIAGGQMDGLHYIFRARCRTSVATGGWGAQVAHQVAQLPQGQLVGVLQDFDEQAGGWNGTKTGFSVVGSGSERTLEATGAQNFSNVASNWAAWAYWNATPTSPAVYTSAAYDLGVAVAGQFGASIDADGTVLMEIRTSPDGSTWSAWMASTTPFFDEFVQVRVTVTGACPAIRKFRYYVRGLLQQESATEVVTASLPSALRYGVGDVRVPTANTYNRISSATVTSIDDSNPAGWTWRLVDLGSSVVGPRFQFFHNGVAADPQFVNFHIEGY